MIHRTPGRIVYTDGDKPDVEVLIDGEWRQGQLQSLDRRSDGTWAASVKWRRGEDTFWDSFARTDVRLTSGPSGFPGDAMKP